MTNARVLIVEDEALVADNLAGQLEQLGYTVAALAASGEQAIRQAAETRPDVVLMDIRLQGATDGIQTAAAMRAQFDLPVVYMTGYLDEATLQRAQLTEPFGYIFKPFEARELRVAVELALHKHMLERRLRESEERCRTIAKVTSDFVYMYRIAPEGGMALDWVGGAWQRITGWERDEYEARGGWPALIHPDDLPATLQVSQSLMSGQPVTVEFRIVTRRGETRWLRASSSPMWDAGRQRIVRIVGSAQDITDRKQAEQAMLREKQLSEDIINSMPTLFFMFDDQGKLVRWNEKAEQASGYSAQELAGMHAMDFLAEQDRERVARQMFEVLTEGAADAEAMFVAKTGEQIPYYSVARRTILDGKAWVIGTAVDISERRRIEMALRESEERYRTLYENAPIGIYRTTPDGRILMANPALVRILGYSSFDELATRNLEYEGFEPDYLRSRFKALMEQTGHIIGLEAAWTKRDGSVISVRENVQAIRGGDGAVLYYEGTAEDITERKQTEEAVRENRQLLQSVMDNIPQAIFWKDRNLSYRGCNRAFAAAAGLASAQDILGKTDWDMPWQEQAELDRADDTRVMESGAPKLDYEEPQTMPDGALIWRRTSKVPLRDAGGNVTAVLGMYEDITERKQAEDALQQSRAQLARRAEELQAINDIALQFAAEMDTARLLPLIVERSAGLMGAAGGVLHLYDAARDELCFTAGQGLGAEFVNRALKPGEGVSGRVFETRRSLIVDDYATWPGKAAAFEDVDLHAVMGVPLAVGDQVQGVLLILGGASQATFDDHARELAELFAAQAAVALENARLLEVARQRATELALINAAAQALNSTLELNQVLSLVLEESRLMFGATGCSVWLAEAGTDELVCRQAVGPGADLLRGRRLAKGEGLAGWTAQHGEILNIPDVRTDRRHATRIDQSTRLDLRAILTVPLVIKQNVVGVLQAVDTQEGHFARVNPLLLESLATTAAVAVGNARLYDQAQHEIVKRKSAEENARRAAARAEALAQTATRLNSLPDLDAVLNAVCEDTARALNVSSAAVHLLDDQRDVLYPAATFGVPPEELAYLPLIPRAIHDEMVRQYGPVVTLPDVRETPYQPQAGRRAEANVRTLISAAMAREGELIGALSVVTRDALHYFTDDEQALLAGLANQAALAIANARLVQDLRRAEAKYRAIFDGAVEGIFQLRPDWNVLSANPAFARMLGYASAEQPPLSVAELLTVPQERRVEFVRLIEMHNMVRGFEMPMQLRDGRKVWLSINARAVRGASGETLYYEGFAEDVTLPKQVQERLAHADRLAAVGQLAASVAHEINNPLQSILGCLGLAQEALESGEEATQYLKVARDEVRRISRIVGRMREMYRPESDDKVSTDMNALVEQVLDLVRKRCQEDQIELNWQPAQNLPGLFIAPDQIKQVLLNLLLNAIDAMPGGGRVCVSIARVQEPDGIQIVVADNGTGIPPEVLPRIFDAFYSTKPAGSGLGLAISSNIVAKHDGRIQVESPAGQGSTFTVWLPRSPALAA